MAAALLRAGAEGQWGGAGSAVDRGADVFGSGAGEGGDTWDVRGRVAHESLFNVNDGSYRAASSQQGYSPFTTWTRGHAWCVCGYPEELEYLETVPDGELAKYGGRKTVEEMMRRSALAVADFYLEQTPLDGIPYWDTGAPGLAKM